MANSDMESTRVLKVMEKVFSSKYGLANYLSSSTKRNLIVPSRGNSFTIGNVTPMFRTIINRTKGSESSLWAGGGASLMLQRSRIKAYGEFIERYCAVAESVPGVVFDSYDNLKANGITCLDPKDVIHFENCLYENPEFSLKQYIPHRPISWVGGKDLVNSKEALVPIQKVLLGYQYPKNEPHFLWGLSTGLACGSSYVQASLSAIYEVVERDSFMLTWLLQIPGTQIHVDKIANKHLEALYKHVCKHLVGEDRLYMYDISKTDGIFTVLTFIRNDLPNAYGLIVSAAFDMDIEIALLKSLEELCHTQTFAYSTLIGDELRTIQNLKKQDAVDLHKHFFYYSTGRNSHCIDFISTTDEHVYLSKLSGAACKSDTNKFESIVDIFRRNGNLVYLVDITKPEIRDIGLTVVKAVVPGYIDLDINHNFRQTNNARLREYQEMHGAELNDNPHPFP